ncbi:MAG: hypothetical protein WCI18_06530 [Pseudomonadota bacterium]
MAESIIKFVLIFGLFLGSRSQAETMPILSHMGVVPSQFVGDQWAKLAPFEDTDTMLKELIEESKRFQVLEPELVKELWSTPDGRDELKASYRLDVLLNVSFVMMQDHGQITARLLSPEMKMYLQESENWPLKLVESRSRDEIKAQLKQLIYRFFNRIPMDVSITSVQDKFITLSGGIEQAIHVGDQVQLARVSVKSLHPILGTWETFQVAPVGEARIIESRNNVSVARLTSEVRSSSISVGDGVRISGILSRRLFAEEAKKAEVFDKPGVLVMPLQSESPLPETVKDLDSNATKPLDPSSLKPVLNPVQSFPGSSREIKPTESGGGEPVAASNRENDDVSPSKPFFADASMPGFLSALDLRAGHDMWSFKGRGNTESKFALFPPLNTFGAKGNMLFGANLGVGADVELGFGSTSKGSFKGYGLGGRSFWTSKVNGVPFVDSWAAGIRADLRGKSVEDEVYGGFDLIQGGVFLGMSGSVVAVKKLNYEFEYSLMPLSIGRVGYSGGFKSVRSAFGSEMSGQVLSGIVVRNINWGGGFHYSNYNMLDESGKETVSHRFSLEAVGRMTLK